MNSIVIYEPNQRSKMGMIKTWWIMLGNIAKSRDLIFQLWYRDFLMRFKKSFLGLLWVVITPLINVAVWIFLNAAGIINPGVTGVSYAAYALVGVTFWQLFQNMVLQLSQTLTVGNSFIQQVNYPHDALMIKQLLQVLSDFTIAFVFVLIVLPFLGITPSWKTLLIPVLILPMFFLAGTIGLILSVFNAVTQDFNTIVSLTLRMLMFVTPIVYAPRINNPILQKVVNYNPLTYIVADVRDVILTGHFVHPREFWWATSILFLIFLLTWRMFYILEERVIEKML